MTTDEAIVVTLFLYNRPEYLSRQLIAVEALRPRKVYVFLDGADSSYSTIEAQEKISLTLGDASKRGLNVEFRRWPKNLGTQESIKSGLDEVFSREAFSVILEDDCIPTEAFGRFVRSVKKQVEAEASPKIGTISGNYFGSVRHEAHLSKFPRTWGWATWSSIWEKFDPSLALDANALDLALDWGLGGGIFSSPQRLHWRKRYLDALPDRTMWDAQWTVHNWRERQFSISPGRNLVANIGNDERAVHASGDSSFVNWPVSAEFGFSLKVPMIYTEEPDRAERLVFRSMAYRGLVKKWLRNLTRRWTLPHKPRHL